MKLVSMIKFLCSRPLNQKSKKEAVWRYIKWQISCRLNNYPVIYPFTANCSLLLSKSLTGATGNLYCGLHEFEDMGFLLHFLRKEDYFADIGANIGSYTVLASGHIGANSISFEPVPNTFSYLIQNIHINKLLQKVQALNLAIGAVKGSISFTRSLDTMNHVACLEEKDTIDVCMEKLDDILVDIPVPSLLKIDVEGFETEVLNGATAILQRSELKAIIIELNGSGSRYGYDEKLIHNKLVASGFNPFNYAPLTRQLLPLNTFGSYNTIYIRDYSFVHERIATAPLVELRGTRF